MRFKKYIYSPKLSFNEKWWMVLFLEDIIHVLPFVSPPNRDGVTDRILIKVIPYNDVYERRMFYKFIRYINAHPHHLSDSVKKWSVGRVKYSRLLIRDSDEIGYVDISLLYRT